MTHVVTRFFADFIVKLDGARFERFVWSTTEVQDAVTGEIAGAVDHFVPGESSIAGQLAREIRAADLDVLVYLDVVLDPRHGPLAALRLAPVQAAVYGHPVTTGLDGVDYFLGGELMEGPGSDAQYREKLVRLPNLGASIRPAPAGGDGRWAEALRRPSKPLAMCLQNLAKIPPSFDATLAQVLARSAARLVFFNRGARLTAVFRARLDRALDAHGVARDAVHVENLRPHADYLAGIARADLVLDTPGFSGGATTLDALAVATPVVCFPGQSARARQSAAALRRIGIEETIVPDACKLRRESPSRSSRTARSVSACCESHRSGRAVALRGRRSLARLRVVPRPGRRTPPPARKIEP